MAMDETMTFQKYWVQFSWLRYEGGFSVQNKTTTKKRTELSMFTQHKLVSEQLTEKINLREVLDIWKYDKKRRIYELKY